MGRSGHVVAPRHCARKRSHSAIKENLREGSETDRYLPCTTRVSNLVAEPIPSSRGGDKADLLSLPAEDYVAILLGISFSLVWTTLKMGMASRGSDLDFLHRGLQVLRARRGSRPRESLVVRASGS